ncbi:predicted protein [Naegleria gruberi]|uniref:Predicted protein n=1 Tax=Naegleria gruberi TaxID=5762 RepID=D2V5K3_NAEGR|nr:uncharacterized protein NAEGRDRAFT_78668 [Naegleria gruberi]EFC47813.1 predicted protein [Naegleria gruberi]|eukprot:XP_002680557.1 predicted protein [Naegleria gruberi strain NEG-M]
MKRHQPIAILYQAIQPPTIDGILKPCKPGGYKDSGADIAFNLLAANRTIVTPQRGMLHLHDMLIRMMSVDDAKLWDDLEWVFPDSKEGIEECLKKGAKVIWANTVLFEEHPLHDLIRAQQKQVESQCEVSEWCGLDLRGVEFVGQHPKLVQQFDDKFDTNQMLKKENLPVANSLIVSTREKLEEMKLLGFYKEGIKILEELSEESLRENGIEFPLIIKPVRGRGSEGVEKVDNFDSFVEKSTQLINQTIQVNNKPVPKYGYYFIVEEFLNGDELTLTVMPPGNYIMYDIQEMEFSNHWALPPVKRFNHQNGVAPYNGIVAVVNNSVVLKDFDSDEAIQKIIKACEKAAELVQAKAPIRIDCRSHQTSDSVEFKMFDLNMKPNMTGPGRDNRDNQDSLSAIAAREIGWNYQDLLLMILNQSWH